MRAQTISIPPASNSFENWRSTPSACRSILYALNDGQEQMKAAMAEHAVEIAAKTMKDNGESIATTEGPLPPVGPGEVSIAEPKDRPRRTVHRGKCKGEHQLGSQEERMAFVNAIPEIKRVYEIMGLTQHVLGLVIRCSRCHCNQC